jgi:hypothetical protein
LQRAAPRELCNGRVETVGAHVHAKAGAPLANREFDVVHLLRGRGGRVGGRLGVDIRVAIGVCRVRGVCRCSVLNDDGLCRCLSFGLDPRDLVAPLDRRTSHDQHARMASGIACFRLACEWRCLPRVLVFECESRLAPRFGLLGRLVLRSVCRRRQTVDQRHRPHPSIAHRREPSNHRPEPLAIHHRKRAVCLALLRGRNGNMAALRVVDQKFFHHVRQQLAQLRPGDRRQACFEQQRVARRENQHGGLRLRQRIGQTRVRVNDLLVAIE